MTDEELFEELINPTIVGITLWYRFNSKSGDYEYNHFEDVRDNHLLYPHDLELFPRPVPNVFVSNSIQKSWKNQKWKYTLGRFNTKTNNIIEEGELI